MGLIFVLSLFLSRSPLVVVCIDFSKMHAVFTVTSKTKTARFYQRLCDDGGDDFSLIL